MTEGSATAEMLKVCEWYSADERKWLWDSIWHTSLYSHATCSIIGLLGLIFLGITSCRSIKTRLVRGMSITFGLIAIVNIMPLLIYSKSDLCIEGNVVCDGSQTNCVNSCKMGSGSWQLFALSFMWVSCMVTTWAVEPYDGDVDIEKGMESHGSGDSWTKEESLDMSDINTVSSDEELNSVSSDAELDMGSIDEEASTDRLSSPLQITKEWLKRRSKSYDPENSVSVSPRLLERTKSYETEKSTRVLSPRLLERTNEARDDSDSTQEPSYGYDSFRRAALFSAKVKNRNRGWANFDEE